MAALTQRLGCSSRTIRNMLAALRDAGYEIEQKRSLGYRLLSPIDDISLDLVGNLYRQLYEKVWLLYAEVPCSLTYIAERFYISRSQAKKDIDAILSEWDERIQFTRTSKGLVIQSTEKERKREILHQIEQYSLTAGECHTLFDFLQNGQSGWLPIFKVVSRHLITKGISVPDSTLIWFVNELLLQKRFPAFWPFYSDHSTQQFEQLKTELASLLCLSDQQWQCIEAAYESVFLGIIPASIKTQAAAISERFFDICQTQYHLEFGAGERKALNDYLERYILLPIHQRQKETVYLEQIKQEYFHSYAIALEFRYIFDAFGIDYEEADLAMLALVIHLVQMADLRGPKVNVYLISDHDDLFNFFLLQSLKDTLNPRFMEARALSLFQFHQRLNTLSQENVLILCTDASPLKACADHQIPVMRIHPFLNADTVAAIQSRIMMCIRDKQRRLTCQMVEHNRSLIHSGPLNESHLLNIRMQVQCKGWIIYQGLPVVNELILDQDRLWLTFDPSTPEGHQLILLRDLIVSQSNPQDFIGQDIHEVLLELARQEP